MKCFICQKEADKKCSVCKNVAYCSVEHQKLDWKNHKRSCRPPNKMTEEEGQQLHKIFSTAVVWRTLGTYLNFSDLKSTRLVCRSFNEKILTDTTYKQRAVVTLAREQLSPQIFGRTQELWSNFKIDLHTTTTTTTTTTTRLPCHQHDDDDQKEDTWDWLYPLFKSARSIQVTCDLVTVEKFDKKADHQQQKCYYEPSLHQIVGVAGDLQSFGVGSNLLLMILDAERKKKKNKRFHNNPLLDCLSSEAARKTLEGIQEFHILLTSNKFDVPSLPANKATTDAIAKLVTVLKNIQVFTVEDISIQLHRAGRWEEHFLVSQNLQKHLGPLLNKIIEKNQSHLKKLHCDQLSVQSLLTTRDDKKKKFPQLKSLIMYGITDEGKENSSHNKNLIKFLQQQPHLLELDLATTLASLMPNEVLILIREKGQQLKRLRLKFVKFRKPADNWSFLSNLKHLEEFEMDISTFFHGYQAKVGPLVNILSSLPGKTMRKISLNGIPFYSPNDFVCPPAFGNLNRSQLTVLKLNRYECAITDKTLMAIFSNFLMLQVFELSQGYKCTDFGFTGIGGGLPDPLKFSIKDLKGLKSLMIRDCMLITNKTCHVIAFSELKTLDFSRNHHITLSGINTILKNNPSLEYLKISPLHRGEDRLLTRPPRFRVLEFRSQEDRDSQMSEDQADIEEM